MPDDIEYTIRKGDTLIRIARRFGLRSWRSIWYYERNRELLQRRGSPRRIRPGDVIYIPRSDTNCVRIPTRDTDRNRHRLIRVRTQSRFTTRQPTVEPSQVTTPSPPGGSPILDTISKIDSGREVVGTVAGVGEIIAEAVGSTAVAGVFGAIEAITTIIGVLSAIPLGLYSLGQAISYGEKIAFLQGYTLALADIAEGRDPTKRRIYQLAINNCGSREECSFIDQEDIDSELRGRRKGIENVVNTYNRGLSEDEKRKADKFKRLPPQGKVNRIWNTLIHRVFSGYDRTLAEKLFPGYYYGAPPPRANNPITIEELKRYLGR